MGVYVQMKIETAFVVSDPFMEKESLPEYRRLQKSLKVLHGRKCFRPPPLRLFLYKHRFSGRSEQEFRLSLGR